MWAKLEAQLDRFSPEEQGLIAKAFSLSLESHKGQVRMTGEPYIVHPIAVAQELIKLKLDAPTIAAALLHDVLEDTDLTEEELKKEVGEEVTFLVESLTKLDRIRYQGFERKVESTRKMFLAVAKDIRVVLIKLADRLHNMRTIGALAPAKQKRIAQETLELYAPLAYRLGIGEFKGELEDLAFPLVYPEEYAWLEGELKEILPKRTQYLAEVTPFVEHELKKSGITPISIHFRTKHRYSLWKKLLRYNLDFARITDLIALRIIVKTVEECYQTLGIIHALWPPVPGRIKDYIAMPKPNGYKSLHTTVICLDNVITEFQIRTEAIHEEAEFGVTAHWVWEEAGKPKSGIRVNESKIEWVKKLSQWQKEFSERKGEDFLEALKIDFFKDRIFVLTPKGEVIDLPEGSTPVDFAYHIHSDIGDHMAGAKINSKMAAFGHELVSGDMVEIITQKNQKPNPDWLWLARSSLARSHIRSALRKLGYELRETTRKKSREKETTLFITSENRIGMIKDISTVLSKEHINITKTDSDVHDPNKPHLVISFQAPRTFDLERLLIRLRRIKGIRDIEVKS